jgi:hypothetical protein
MPCEGQRKPENVRPWKSAAPAAPRLMRKNFRAHLIWREERIALEAQVGRA